MALKYLIDGNQVCAVAHDFKCLATDFAGFGDSLKEAFINYYITSKLTPKTNDCHSWELPWVALIRNEGMERVDSLTEVSQMTGFNASTNDDLFIEKLHKEIALLKNQWVSVDNGLPTALGGYLTYWTDGSLETFDFLDEVQAKGWVTDLHTQKITHWMPLPEPPKECDK